jgi:hypothetical protein
MELSSEQFLEKYNFAKPSPDDRKIVLTCRSGKRVLVRKVFFTCFRATLNTPSAACYKVSLLQAAHCDHFESENLTNDNTFPDDIKQLHLYYSRSR